MEDFSLLESPHWISRKIWVLEKSWNFHTVILSVHSLPLIFQSFNKKLRLIDVIEVNISFLLLFFSIKMPSSQFFESSFENLMWHFAQLWSFYVTAIVRKSNTLQYYCLLNKKFMFLWQKSCNLLCKSFISRTVSTFEKLGCQINSTVQLQETIFQNACFS